MSFKQTIEQLNPEELANRLIVYFKDNGINYIYDPVRACFGVEDEELRPFINENELIVDAIDFLLDERLIVYEGEPGMQRFRLEPSGRRLKQGINLHNILGVFVENKLGNIDAQFIVDYLNNSITKTECIRLCKILIDEGDLNPCNSKMETFGVCTNNHTTHAYNDEKYLSMSFDMPITTKQTIIGMQNILKDVSIGGDFKPMNAESGGVNNEKSKSSESTENWAKAQLDDHSKVKWYRRGNMIIYIILVITTIALSIWKLLQD